jgi:hypothetical protein
MISLNNRFKDKPKYVLFDQHYWVDYFELLCLVNIDGEMDIATMKDRVILKERDAIDSSIEDSEDFFDNDGVNYLIGERDTKESFDVRFADYFKHYKSREKNFGDFYPFIVEDKKLTLKKGIEDSVKIKLYIYLLCCSSLNYFSDFMAVFTADFEEVCYEVLKKMLPQNRTELLGKTISGNKRIYKGNVYSKLKQLADDLSVSLRVTSQDFATTSSGDGGLDLISWQDYKDGINSIPTYSVQCKCSPKWTEASDPANLLEGYFDLDHPPMSLFCIPFSYRKSNGDWHQRQHVKRKIVIDRLRICRLLNNDLEFFNDLTAMASINLFINEKESVI